MARDTIPISGEVLVHLRRLGVDVPAVAGEVTTEAFFAFWRAVAAADERAQLGLEIGAAVFGRSLSAQVALQAPTLGDALRTIGRYKRLACPEDVLVEVRDGKPSVRFDWVLATGEVPPLLVDAIFASHVALVARGTGGKAPPVRIELARGAVLARVRARPTLAADLLDDVHPQRLRRGHTLAGRFELCKEADRCPEREPQA